MKTMKKLLCIVLCLLTVFGTMTVAMAAEPSGKYQYHINYYADKDTDYFAKQVLDKLDELLPTLGSDGKGIVFKVDQLGLTIDLTSVNGICDTLDLLKDLLTRDKLIDTDYSTLLGDLKYLNLGVWQEGMKRGTQDELILKEILELVGTTEPKKLLLGSTDEINPEIIAGLLDGDASLGVLDSFFDINDLLGSEGISGIVKDLLFSIMYEKGSAQFNSLKAAFNNDIDGFVYGPLLEKLAGEYLQGFDMNKDTKVEALICSLFNAVIDNYVIDLVKQLNVDLATQENEALVALSQYVNLKGDTYNLEGIALDANKPLINQVNDLFGKIFAQIVEDYEWETGEDYTLLSKNIENLFKFIGKETGLIPNADEMTREEVVEAVVAVILENIDLGDKYNTIKQFSSIEDIATAALAITANDMGIDKDYSEADYTVILGDMLSTWACANFKFTDNNGKVYEPAQGDDVWTVANYFANYFLFDRGGAEVLNLNIERTDSIFTKLDKLADLFGANGKVNFDSKKFLLGEGDEIGLIDSIFTLDLQNVIDITVVPALDTAGNVKAVEFIYNTIRYFIGNWSGDKNAIIAYDGSDKAFTNLLTNKNIAKLLSSLLKSVAAKKDGLVNLVTYILTLVFNDLGMPKITVKDYVYSGSKAAPEAVVSFGTTVLKQGRDYVVESDATEIGPATAYIKFIGSYKGNDVEVPFNVVFEEPAALSVSTSTDAVAVTFTGIPGAAKYLFKLDGNVIQELTGAEVGTDKVKVRAQDLASASKHTVAIEAVSANGTVKSYGEKTVIVKPEKVKKLKASSVKATSLKLSWSAVDGDIEGYCVYSSTDGKKWEKIATTSKTSYTVKSLKGYTTYYFRVRAYAKNGKTTEYGSYSDSVKTKTELGNVEVETEATSNTVKLSWDKVSGAKKYNVDRYDTKSKKWVNVTETSKTSYTFKDLKKGTQYKYRVRAEISSKAYSDWDEISLYTKVSKVSSLKASSTKETSTKLTWSKLSGAKSYTVYSSTDGKKWTKLKTTTSTSYTAKNLAFGTTYKFKVVANTSKTVSEDAIITVKTSAGKVSGLKTTSVKKTSIKLAWTEKSGATGYEVSYRVSGKSWKTVKTTSESITISDLTRSTSYEFKVRAYNKTGNSEYSSVVKAKTSVF